MQHHCDVLVMGGGMAGTAAALAAAQAGAQVCLVRAGPAATALSTGAWRGPLPEPVWRALERAGYPLEVCGRALPRPDGTLLHADHAPPTHARAHIDADRTLVCEIAGLPGFFARPLCTLWGDAGAVPPAVLQPHTLTLPHSPAAGWSPVSLAAQLEREPDMIAEPLARALREHGAARAIVPAVLGLEAHLTVRDQVETLARAPVAEALGATPSIPGWRLDVALRSVCAAAGITVLTAYARASRSAERHLRDVVLSGDVATRTITAASYVLATGKFLGGGIAADPAFVETVLACNVTIRRHDREFDSATESLLLTGELRTDAQPLLTAGVDTDAEARPLDVLGNVAYHNVFLAGSIRAGVETAALGLGAAAADGWHAGARAADFARTRVS